MRNPADIVSCRVKPPKLLSNRSWFSGSEFLTLDKDSWPSSKVGEKIILLSEVKSRGNGVCICDVICKEKSKDNDLLCVTSLIERMVTIVCVQLPLILK